MKISYFQKNNSEKANWDNITRDERYFCSELFHNLRSDQSGILSLIKEGIIAEEKNDKERLNFLKNIESEKFDIGFEVCFYRDMLKWYRKGIRGTGLSQKRTFDLALFSDDAIIIIEAKAQQGFDSKQLVDFEEDKKKNIEILFNKFIHQKVPKVFVIGLHSSKYTPKSTTKIYFDSIIKWKDLATKYPKSKELLNYADSIYRN